MVLEGSGGQAYRVANGHRIYNEGEKKLRVKAQEGNRGNMRFQITDVKKPLAAVRRLNQGGSGVWLDLEERGGSYIQNMTTGRRTKIHQKNGAFILKLLVQKGKQEAGSKVEAVDAEEANFVGQDEVL